METEQFFEKTGQDFNKYYKKFKPKLVRFLIGIGKDEDDAEDVATEAFVTSLNKIDSYDPEKAVFSTWLFTIAKRIMIQKAREKSRFTSLDKDSDEGFNIGDKLCYDDYDYETDHAINYQKSKSIKTLIPSLPEKYATVLTMRHIAYKSYQDIAEELGIYSILIKSEDFEKIEKIVSLLKNDYKENVKLFLNIPNFIKENVSYNRFDFCFKYDSLKANFVINDKTLSFLEMGEILKQTLNVDKISYRSLNLNTVKSRIRQARLLLYNMTKEDFQKLDNLDKDHIDCVDTYNDYEYEKEERDLIEA